MPCAGTASCGSTRRFASESRASLRVPGRTRRCRRAPAAGPGDERRGEPRPRPGLPDERRRDPLDERHGPRLDPSRASVSRSPYDRGRSGSCARDAQRAPSGSRHAPGELLGLLRGELRSRQDERLPHAEFREQLEAAGQCRQQLDGRIPARGGGVDRMSRRSPAARASNASTTRLWPRWTPSNVPIATARVARASSSTARRPSCGQHRLRLDPPAGAPCDGHELRACNARTSPSAAPEIGLPARSASASSARPRGARGTAGRRRPEGSAPIGVIHAEGPDLEPAQRAAVAAERYPRATARTCPS